MLLQPGPYDRIVNGFVATAVHALGYGGSIRLRVQKSPTILQLPFTTLMLVITISMTL